MRFKTLALLFLALSLAMPAMAQEQRGAIEGIVKDSSGAVLPGVTVEAKNTGRRLVITAVTDAIGYVPVPGPGGWDLRSDGDPAGLQHAEAEGP